MMKTFDLETYATINIEKFDIALIPQGTKIQAV